MRKPTRFLVASDLTPASQQACRRAGRLVAEVPGRHLRLLHVIEPGLLAGLRGRESPASAGVDMQDVRSRLEPVASGLRAACGGPVTLELESGPAAETILKACIQEQAELLLLGKGRTGSLRRLMLGSVAESVASRAPLPVLVVRQRPIAPYRRVLVALADTGINPAAVSFLTQVAPEASWVLFHAYDVPIEGQLRYASVAEEVIRQARNAAHAEAVRRLRAWQRLGRKAWSGAELSAVRETAAHGILREEKHQACDLVVVGRHQAGLIERLLLGSVSRRVLANSQVDVLVLPPAASAPEPD